MSPKHLIALLIFMTALSAQSQITLGSRRAVHDNLTGNWLCSVPESTFGTDFTATFNTSEPWSDITIDDEPVAPGDSFTFAQVAGDKKYALVAHIGDSVTITGNICLPSYPFLSSTALSMMNTKFQRLSPIYRKTRARLRCSANSNTVAEVPMALHA